MNSLTSNPHEIVGQARRLEASRSRRTERAVDRGAPRTRPAYAVRLVIVAAIVSAVSVVVVTTTRHDDATRGTKAFAAMPRVDATPQAATMPQAASTRGGAGIDHGAIAPNAISTGDAETVEASIAAYER